MSIDMAELARSILMTPNTTRRHVPQHECECPIRALGADWIARARFDAELNEQRDDEPGGWFITLDSVDIAPADYRIKSDWIAIDYSELSADAYEAIERACVEQMEGA